MTCQNSALIDEPFCSPFPVLRRIAVVSCQFCNRLCHVTRAMRCLVLRTIEIARTLIGRTTTAPGLHVVAEIARRTYKKGRKATAEFLAPTHHPPHVSPTTQLHSLGKARVVR